MAKIHLSIQIYINVDVMSLYFFTLSNLLCQDPRWMEAKSRKRREPANLQPSQLPDVAQLLQANSVQPPQLSGPIMDDAPQTPLRAVRQPQTPLTTSKAAPPTPSANVVMAPVDASARAPAAVVPSAAAAPAPPPMRTRGPAAARPATAPAPVAHVAPPVVAPPVVPVPAVARPPVAPVAPPVVAPPVVPVPAAAPVHEVGAAAPVHEVGPVPAADVPKCIICYDALRGNGHQVEALPCSHVFHEDCLNRWRSASAFQRPRHHCPYRCERSIVAVAGVVDDDAAADADVRELEAAMEVDDEAAEAAVDPAVDGAADEDAAVDDAAVDELINESAVDGAPVDPAEAAQSEDPADLFR